MNYKDIQLEAQSSFFIQQGDLRPLIGSDGCYECQICTNEASGHFYDTGFMLCVLCADYIANVYTHLRRDKFATWTVGDEYQKPSYPRKDVITQSLRTQVFERDAYRCINCSSYKDLAVDHIHPESKGGGTTLENLQTLCRSCNSSKGTKTMEEWLGVCNASN